MCYYNSIRVSKTEIIRLKNEEKQLSAYRQILWRPKQSGFEYGDWPVIKPSVDYNTWDITTMQWGFIPNYITTMEEAKRQLRTGYKDAAGKFRPALLTLNAVGEEMLLPRKIYRDAALKRRCLILSSGFFEWRHIFPANKRTGLPIKTADKYPYHITIPGEEIFYIAGIWQPWIDRETGETIDTFSLVTTKSNELMSKVHNSKFRQPCILTKGLSEEWISANLSETRITEIAGHQFDTEKMIATPIPKNFMSLDEPLMAVEYDDLPAL